jgi:hypothetical protein
LREQHCGLFCEIAVLRDQRLKLRLCARDIVLRDEALGQVKLRSL